MTLAVRKVWNAHEEEEAVGQLCLSASFNMHYVDLSGIISLSYKNNNRNMKIKSATGFQIKHFARLS